MYISRVLGSVVFRAFLAALSLAVAIACGSASSSVTSPTGTKCDISVTNDTPQLSASGGSGTVTVATTRDCRWTAASEAAWIALDADSGQGPATLHYVAQANPVGVPRQGRLTVAEHALDVAQAAAACRYAVADPNVTVDAAGQQIAIDLTATDGCSWNVRGDAPWISGAAPPSGTGSARIQIAIAANTGAVRTGTVTIGSATVHVTQGARGTGSTPPSPTPPSPTPSPTPPASPPPACSDAIKPTSYEAGHGPDSITVNVTAASACAWTTSTSAGWVTIAAGRSGIGNGSVLLTIPPNNGPARSALVTIAGNPFTLAQDGCSASLKPTWYASGRGPDRIQVAVTADPGCTWTAASTVSWAAVTQGANGSGNGIVEIVVQPNGGASRSVTLTIAGQPFALSQEGSP
jgi:hypothetical protein